MRRSKLFAPFFGLLAALPLAAAAPQVVTSISGSMSIAWNAVGSLFSVDLQSPAIAEGLLKFFVFILILRLVQFGLEKTGHVDAKTSGIVGFVVAGITVFFTPNHILIRGLVALLVPLFIVGWMAWVATVSLTGHWLKHLFGAFLLLVAFFINSYAITIFSGGISAQGKLDVSASLTELDLSFKGEILGINMNEFVVSLLMLVAALLLILFIVKILMIFFSSDGGIFSGSGGGGSSSGGGGSGSGKGGRDGKGGNNGKGGGRSGGNGETDEERKAKRKKANDLDWSSPGRVRFYVTNADDNPIAGVVVKVYGVDHSRARWITRRGARLALVYQGETGPDGLAPTRGLYTEIGAGPIRAKAFRGMSSGMTEMVVTSFAELGEVQTIPIQLRDRDTQAQGFEPHIINVYYQGDRLVLEATIDERRGTEEMPYG
jgi:hypothetical protein